MHQYNLDRCLFVVLIVSAAQVMEKAAEEVDLEQRLRMHTLAQALVAFGQGVAFFHAGCEILRSKSLDRDSYNSGIQQFLPKQPTTEIIKQPSSCLVEIFPR